MSGRLARGVGPLGNWGGLLFYKPVRLNWAQMVSLIKEREQELRAICQRRHVARLDLFGSAANGDFKDDSDLDFLVTLQRLSVHDHADAFFGLLFDLEDLFERRIDLIVESTINNPYFRQELENTRKLLYAA